MKIKTDDEKRIFNEISRVHGAEELFIRAATRNEEQGFGTPDMDVAAKHAITMTLLSIAELIREYRVL